MTEAYRNRTIATASALSLVLAACGGGGGGGSDLAANNPTPTGGGIGGSGQSTTSSGTIDGFGSIFVNGVRFETEDAEVIVDGETLDERALRLGMVVAVAGEINADGRNGVARQVVYDNEIRGPIAAIEVSADGDTKLLTILGVKVLVERLSTVFDDVTFDTLAVDDVVEVSGFIGRGDSIRATRLEREERFVPGQTRVEARGRVSALVGDQFQLGSVLVDASQARIVGEGGNSPLAEGDSIKAIGTLEGDVLLAERIVRAPGLAVSVGDVEDAVRIQGTITDFVDPGNFLVNGILVDASQAELLPRSLVLDNGLVVEITGRWEGDVLIAERLVSRRGRIEIEADVSGVDAEAGIVTVDLFPGDISVQVDARTRLRDDDDSNRRLTLADIMPGNFLEVEAQLLDGNLVATSLRLEDEQDDDRLQGPVEAFTAGVDITVLGITYLVGGNTEYEDRSDIALTEQAFFDSLQVGDLVAIEDDELADGIADEIEFENRELLDGEREFLCDDDSCDDTNEDEGGDDVSEEDDLSGEDEGEDDLTGEDDLSGEDDLTGEDEFEEEDASEGADDLSAEEVPENEAAG